MAKKSGVVYSYATIEEDEAIGHKLISYPIANLKLVFFNASQSEKPVKGFYDMITRTNKKFGNEFRTVRAGKYGMRVPSDTTHVSIAGFGASKINKIYTFELLQPHSKILVNFGSKYRVVIRRSRTNLHLAFGKIIEDTKSKKAKKNKAPTRLDSANRKWTQL